MSDLPNAVKGKYYSQAIKTDTDLFYNFKVEGSLPLGLILDPFNGKIIGNPKESGIFTITIVKSKPGHRSKQCYNILIKET